MHRQVMFFATSLAFSCLLGGCATSGEPATKHAHPKSKPDAMILVRGIT